MHLARSTEQNYKDISNERLWSKIRGDFWSGPRIISLVLV